VTKTKIIVLVSFALVFAAGTAVGILVQRSAPKPRHRPEPFAGLDLSAQQREQMREIWSERTGPGRPQMSERRRELEEEREEAFRALLTEAQEEQYEALIQEYEEKFAELYLERRKAFEEKLERTKEILTEPQREKFEEFIEEGKRMGRQLLPGRPGLPGHRYRDGPAHER
jgi:Spy/CpxP family protein refolding chaperone